LNKNQKDVKAILPIKNLEHLKELVDFFDDSENQEYNYA